MYGLNNPLLIKVYDGTGNFSVLRTDGEKPDLIGFQYPLQAVKVEIIKNGFCQRDLHYNIPRKEPIPVGFVVEPTSYWINFYGDYFRVTYKDKVYDISTRDVKILHE